MEQSRIDLSKYRLEQAEQCIKSSQVLRDIQDYRGAANRSYYSIFHSMRSVLALDGVDFAKHSGVISYFRKTYIKTAIFDIKLSSIISEAFDIRTDSDYDDFYLLSKADVEAQISNAIYFYNEVRKYIANQIENRDA